MRYGYGFGYGSRRARASGAAAFNPELAASSAALAAYNWTSPGTMTAGAGGPVSNGSTIALVPNVKTPGTLDLGQTTAAARPVAARPVAIPGVAAAAPTMPTSRPAASSEARHRVPIRTIAR